MATIGTILYNNERKQIYPITHAEVTISNAAGSKGTVEDCLLQLFKAISDLTGDSEAATSIMVKVTYNKTKINSLSEIKKLETGWTDIFESPDANNPYVWKHTIFTYKGQEQTLNELYEIVAADTAEKQQTIYIARSTGTAPTITYPILVDGYGNPILDENGQQQENLAAFDVILPEGWSATPVSIGPSTPYVFMATRTRINGLWRRYSEPAQYGRWAFDSQVEFRYSITSDATPPVLEATKDNPGSNWTENTPDDFVGRLWMITATSVNGILNSSNNIRWQGPHLISIIK